MEVLNVLVVDDEDGIRSGVIRILRNFSVSYPFMDDDIQFNLIEAATGEQALEIINNNPLAIVLLDNKLPGIQGVEVLEYINSNQLNILVIMITSYASLDLAVKATNKGAYDFVPKPFTPQELKASMESVTKHYFLRRMTRKLYKEGKHVRYQFLNLLSHEIKVPLNAIELNLKKIQEIKPSEEIEIYKKLIDHSLSQINTIRGLIVDLLDLTRIETGKSIREVHEVDLGLIAKLSIDSLMPLAIQRDVTIKFDQSTAHSFIADPEEMNIIFNNLLSNAIKYNSKRGSVNCSIVDLADEVIIEISDTGIGITQDNIPKLFKDFSPIAKPGSNSFIGSGLGLSQVKRIVDLYNGKIAVESKLAVGSKFSVYLPKKQ